jgi:ABC-type multidrug transport system fused ATPase/permease subunit
VTHADRIVVLADGRVAEQGAHQELIDRGGLYAQLWQIQSQSVQPLGN